MGTDGLHFWNAEDAEAMGTDRSARGRRGVVLTRWRYRFTTCFPGVWWHPRVTSVRGMFL